MLSHDDLALILAVARAGRMKQVAEMLQTHPATAYRRLEALERRLGNPLFERGADGYVPTMLAEEIIQRAGDIEQRLDELNRAVAGRDNRLRGTLKVTTADTLAYIVAPIVLSFADAHPQMSVELQFSNAMADMARNEADVAIRPTHAPPEALVGQRAARFGFAAYSANDDGGVRDMTELLATRRWIGLAPALMHAPAARWLRDHVPTERVGASVDSFFAAAVAARSGAHALLPSYLGDEPSLGLARLSEPVPELASEIWVLTHPDLRHAARVRAFTRHAAKALRERLA